MKLDEIISSRHSIRDYESKDVSSKLIGEILDAARNAPSSGNIQNWQVIIVKDLKSKEGISKSCLNQPWMSKAPVHLVICYDERNAKALYPEDYEKFSIQNTSIFAAFIMLKAAELSLGTCWVAVSNAFEISSILKLPDYIIPSIIITLGYPRGMHKKTTRDKIETIIHFEQFGTKKINTTIFPLSKYSKKASEKIRGKLRKKR